MQVRQRAYSLLSTKAHKWQTRHYFQPAIIALYLLAILFADERQRVELWQQVGVNLTRLSRGALRVPASNAANWCFAAALRHGDASQKGAIRRDKAELLSKLGRFEEAQKQIRLSAKIFLKNKDIAGLRLTRIVRAVVYYRWAVSLPTGHRRSNLLCNAFEGLERVIGETSLSDPLHQTMLAQLWLSDVCIELYLDEREADWLTRAEKATGASLQLVTHGAGSSAHASRARNQMKTIRGLQKEVA